MAKPQISLLMPFRDAEPYLGPALVSLQKQSFTDWEVIGIDDHSIDQSRLTFQSFAAADARFKSFRAQGDGVIDALHQALAVSRGKWIGRADADDLYPPRRLELLRKALLKAGPRHIATGRARYFRTDSEVSDGMRRYQDWLNQTNREGSQRINALRECPVA